MNKEQADKLQHLLRLILEGHSLIFVHAPPYKLHVERVRFEGTRAFEHEGRWYVGITDSTGTTRCTDDWSFDPNWLAVYWSDANTVDDTIRMAWIVDPMGNSEPVEDLIRQAAETFGRHYG